MAVLARSSSSLAAAVVALALASVVAGEVFFQEKFDGESPGSGAHFLVRVISRFG